MEESVGNDIFIGKVASHGAVALIDLTKVAVRELTFEWLHAQTLLFTSTLVQLLQPHTAVVGVLSERCPEAIAAVLSIWRIGSIYLPLNVTNQRRARFCARRCCSSALFVHMEGRPSARWDSGTQARRS